MKKNILLFVSFGLLVGATFANAQSNPLFKKYKTGLDDVVSEALHRSKELKSLEYQQNSFKETVDLEKGYFYPKVSVDTEFKHFYGDVLPEPENLGEVILNVNSKIYSDAVDDKIKSAEFTEQAGLYTLKGKEEDIYYTVLKALTKIERSRFYVYEMGILRKEILKYIALQKKSTRAGVSPVSDLKESELVLSRFDDVIYGVKSDIERSFNDLKIATGFETKTPDEVGLPVQELLNLTDKKLSDFNSKMILRNNFKIISQEKGVVAAKYAVNAQREKIKVVLVNETHANYLDDSDLSIGDIKTNSYFGAKLVVDLFDYQKDRSSATAYYEYLAQKETLESDKEKMLSQAVLLEENYKSLSGKRKNLLEQIRLNRSLIQNQKNELLTNRITYLDLVESLQAFNKTFTSLLDLDVQLYDTVYDYWALNSERVF